jgi:hypothetical protein
MNLKKIYNNLGLETDLKKEILKFNERIHTIVHDLERYFYSELGEYDDFLLNKALFKIGLAKTTRRFKLFYLVETNNSESSLKNNLLLIQIILDLLKQESYAVSLYSEATQDLELKLKETFDLALLNIGYKFQDGEIIKIGAKELDEKLVLENLEWLKNYPDSKEKFSNALRYYFKKNYPDAITNTYSALEGIVKVFLNRDVRLDKEEVKIELLKKLNLDSYWNKIINNYCEIAHEFSSRHGRKKQKGQILKIELVEFYIYITGVFIRLISQKMN